MRKLTVAAIALGCLLGSPASAQEADAACRPGGEAARRGPSALGGLLNAARQAGLGEALMAQAGQGRNGAMASAILGAAMSGDSGAVAAALPATGDPRTNQLANAAVGTAMSVIRSGGKSGCRSAAEPQAPAASPPATSSDTADVWR